MSIYGGLCSVRTREMIVNLADSKICVPSSSGGHLTQMFLLMPVLKKSKDRFWITFDKEDAKTLLENEIVYNCYYPTNHNAKNLLRNTILAIRVLAKERPNLIISSGAAVAVPFFYIGKLFGAKLVYVEVFERVNSATLTGRLVSRIADLFIVQWEEQLEVYPRAVNLGSVF